MKTQIIETQVKSNGIYFDVKFHYTDRIAGDWETPAEEAEVDLISIKIETVELMELLDFSVVDDIERKCYESMM